MLKNKMGWLALAALPLMLASLSASAQSPVGRWKTIDDNTGQVKSIVEITQAANGTLSGRVAQVLQSDRGPNPTCDKCSGDRRNRPITGMTILWDMRPDGSEWSGGTILDPANGKTYRSKAKMLDANRLGVSGCVAFICREQVWQRE
ncbi:hypothetical protein CMZ82_08875 [Lysobacteraceae bacterium NML93-0792]|nr:hypothetical protein CMZ82_08875 [Xanthomonadaceae bacterium NML93-0792]PBS15656.1 hypothetical protein CMZ81_10210 [Xanthomonadaceae bacterium NML93-0793]PBS18194.1 hypothetical protein CMZ80_12610 [Xanthomonadaceae bacterium NML93-0831]